MGHLCTCLGGGPFSLYSLRCHELGATTLLRTPISGSGCFGECPGEDPKPKVGVDEIEDPSQVVSSHSRGAITMSVGTVETFRGEEVTAGFKFCKRRLCSFTLLEVMVYSESGRSKATSDLLSRGDVARWW